jgi:hypothetical protein
LDINVIYLILSAIFGGLITLIVTYQNNSARRFELEYNYRKKLEEKYLSNAQNHLEDVYLSLYSKLICFHNDYLRFIYSDNNQKLENEMDQLVNEIYELKKFKIEIEKNGLTIFLTQEIENLFNELLDFLLNSKGTNKISYGILQEYNLLGIRYSVKRELPTWIKPFFIFVFLYIFIDNIFRRFSNQGLSEFSMRIFYISAPIVSEEFENQLSHYIFAIKHKIREVALGTK